MPTQLSHLDALEAESIHIFREVAAEFEKPVLLFSGGKDSIVMARLAEKAFWPARIPFPLMHVDTGHNFQEVLDYRDRRVAELGVGLVVASVQESIDAGRVVEETGPRASRNRLQTVTLLDAIKEHGFDAVFGGGRRDEEKARAKERVYSFRDDFGQWDPKNQRPELWNLYNGRHRKGEHIRVFPLSNWTELDIWQYIKEDDIEIPSIYYAHRREVFRRDGMWLAVSPFITLMDGEEPLEMTVRYRTVGDASCTGAVESPAATVDEVIMEVAASRITERGADPRRRQVRRGRHGRPQARGLLLEWRACRWNFLRFATAGLGRRRQEHAHRAAAARHQADLRGSARVGRAHEPRQGLRLHQPRAAHRRPARRAGAGHHHRRRLPLLRHAAPQVHHRRHARARAVHAQHGHRRVDRRPRAGAHRRAQGRARAVAPPRGDRVAAPGEAPRAVRQQDGPRRLRPGSVRRDLRRVHRVRHQARDRRPHVHPGVGAARRQHHLALAEHGRGTKARRCCTTSSTCTSRPTATSSTCGSRCST